MRIAETMGLGGKRAFGRRIWKGQFAGWRAPGGAIQRQAGKFGIQNFRPVMGAKTAMHRGRPQPDGKTGRLTPRTAGALVCRRAADTFGRQPGKATCRIEAGAASLRKFVPIPLTRRRAWEHAQSIPSSAARQGAFAPAFGLPVSDQIVYRSDLIVKGDL